MHLIFGGRCVWHKKLRRFISTVDVSEKLHVYSQTKPDSLRINIFVRLFSRMNSKVFLCSVILRQNTSTAGREQAETRMYLEFIIISVIDIMSDSLEAYSKNTKNSITTRKARVRARAQTERKIFSSEIICLEGLHVISS